MNKIQICLANNMRHYRKILKLSQEKLADKAGASANYIALIENGKYFPSLQMLGQIADALEVDSLDLFDKQALDYPNLETIKTKLLENIVTVINNAFEDA